MTLSQKNFIVFTLILFGILISDCFFRRNNQDVNGTRTITNELKGYAIVAVVWAHIGACYDVYYIQFIAGLGVSVFLLCSGYGIEKSFEINGLKNFWTKRIRRVIIPFYIIMLVQMLATKSISFENIIKIVTLQYGYYWFVQYIVVCYLIFWISKLFSKGETKLELLMYVVAFTIVWLKQYYIPYNVSVPNLIIRQVLCFPMGIAIARYERIFGVLGEKYKNLIMLLSVGGCSSIAVQELIIDNLYVSYIIEMVGMAMIAVSICGLYYWVRDDKKVLYISEVGKISYELYLLNNAFFFLLNGSVFRNVIVLSLTVISALFFHGIFKKIMG